nr:protein spt2-like isoform X1 [Ipomoea batatas]
MEELEYLELRQKLKERFRKKMKKELGTGSASSSRNINFGSFFGPSQPVIAQRVIQESKSLLENPDLAAKVMRKNTDVKTKIQMLKNTRDYSFLLSDDADVPAPSKASLPQKSSAPNSGSKPSQPAREPKKEPIRSNGSVRGQHMAPKNHPLKPSTGMNERKSSTLDVKRPMPNLPRPNPSKLQPSISKQALVQKKMPQESSKPKMIQKPAMPSSRPPVAMQKHAVPSSKPQVVMYNPNRYRDDDDDSDMEAGFDDILREERHR